MANNQIDADTLAEGDLGDHAELESTGTGMGLDENVAGALAYLFGVITGVIFYVVEQENAFVRFHAAQSIAVFGLVFVASIGLSILGMLVSAVLFTGTTGGFIVGSIVSLLLTLVWLVVTVGTFGLWLYLMVRAYQGKTPRVPIAAGIADKLV